MEPMKRLFILRYSKGTITEDALQKLKEALPLDTVFVPIEFKVLPAGQSIMPLVDIH